MAYAPAILWAGLLLYLGGRSDVPAVETTLPLDKAAHFVLYGVLGALIALGHRRAAGWPRFVWPVVLALAAAAGDELHQHSVAGRSADVLDWCADALGIAAGCGLVLMRRSDKAVNGV